jgi:D-sedoheptulose 7-phosphate isomerase
MKTGYIRKHFREHQRIIEQSIDALEAEAEEVGRVLVEALRAGNKIIAFGNGGSATQASHLVGELMGRYSLTRQPFPAVALASDAGTVTCIANDFGYDALFERQVQALVVPGDVAIGYTTSGRSENVRLGLIKAGERGAITIAVTGAAGLIGATADHVLSVPSTITAYVQEVHLMLLHVWCIYIDAELGEAQSE